ncbi:MAG: hypothetical protein JEZ11_18345 [Desulfobacterales bacterium]|nr:hypothetical protein [Desulfobacterales bacterium]
MTNDPARSRQNLIVTGPVDQVVTISPSRVVLRGEAGSDIRVQTTIVPEKRFPFKVVSISAGNGGNIRYDLSERQDGSGGYLLAVENIKTSPGRYHDTIQLTTDSQIKPKITIAVYGHILGRGQKSN